MRVHWLAVVLALFGLMSTFLAPQVEAVPPPAPTMREPVNNSYINNTNPPFIFEVNPDIENDSQHFEVGYALDVSFTGGMTFDSSIPLHRPFFTPTPPLRPADAPAPNYARFQGPPGTSLKEGRYYWRMRSKDGVTGEIGGATSVWTFVIDTTPVRIQGVSVDNSFISPNNSVGVKDSATVSYSLSETASVTIEVLNASGTVVRTLANSVGKLPGPNSQNWDGRNDLSVFVPDGVYTIRIRATDSAGNAGTPQNIQVTVDNTTPEITNHRAIPSPFSPNGDGIMDNTSIEFTTAETTSVTVRIYDGGVMTREVVLNQTRGPGNHAWIWNGRNDSGFIVRDNTYTYRIDVVDQAGNGNFQTGNVVVKTTGPVINPYGANPVYFNPALTSTSISYTLNENCTLEIDIENEAGTVVRNLEGPVMKNGSIPYSVAWDGRNDGAVLQSSGRYIYRIKATNGVGITTTVTGNIYIDQVNPTITSVSVSPQAFSPSPVSPGVKDTTTVTYTLSEQCTVTIQVLLSGSVIHTIAVTNPQSAGVQSAVWDGTGNSGEKTYTIRISAVDRAGNAAQPVDVSVIIDITPPAITLVSANPNPFSPNNSPGVKDTTTIGYTLSESGEVTVVIVNAGGQTRSLITNQGRTAGARTEVWNGKDDGGSFFNDGLATINMSVTDGAGNTTVAPAVATVMVDNTSPSISAVSASPDVFSPNGDGRLDTTSFNFILSEDCTVSIQVLDGAVVVRNLVTDKAYASGAQGETWDGKNNTGQVVGDKTYTFRITAMDRAGNQAEPQTGTVTVANQGPSIVRVKYNDRGTATVDDDTLSVEFNIPIDDSTCVGESVDANFVLSGFGVFGTNATISTGMTANDKFIYISMGTSASGAIKAVQNSDTLALVPGAVRSTVGVESTSVSQVIIQDGTPAYIVSAKFRDVANDGITKGDILTLTFNEPVQVITSSPNHFDLKKAGDSLGVGATVSSGATPAQVTITLGYSPVLTIIGVYPAGGASGIDMRAGATSIIDNAGNYTMPNPAGPVDIDCDDTTQPRVVAAYWEDRDTATGAAIPDGFGQNDRVYVVFSKPIIVNGAGPGDFYLPVQIPPGPLIDTFGQGAAVAYSSTKEVYIVLGLNPRLTVRGNYIFGQHSVGSPSGIDVQAGITSITDLYGNLATQSTPVDIGSNDRTAPTVLTARLINSNGQENLVNGGGDNVTVSAILDDKTISLEDITADLSSFGLSSKEPASRKDAGTGNYYWDFVTPATTGSKEITINAKDFSGNVAVPYKFVVNTVEPAYTLIGEMNPSAVLVGSGEQTLTLTVLPAFQSFNLGIDTLRINIPDTYVFSGTGFVEVYVGNRKLTGSQVSLAWSAPNLTITFAEKISINTSNPKITVKFKATVPVAEDANLTPPGKKFTVTVREATYPPNTYQTVLDGNADGIADNNNSLTVVANNIQITSVDTEVHYNSYFWKISFTVKLNYPIDTTIIPSVSYKPISDTTFTGEVKIEYLTWSNDRTTGNGVYTGFVRVPTDSTYFLSDFTLYMRNFKDNRRTLIAELTKSPCMMAPGFIVTVFNNPMKETDMIITIRATQVIVPPPIITISQPGRFLENTVPANKIVEERAFLFRTTYVLDPNYVGQVNINVRGVRAGNAPQLAGTAATAFMVEKVQGGSETTVTSVDGQFVVKLPAGALPPDTLITVCDTGDPSRVPAAWRGEMGLDKAVPLGGQGLKGLSQIYSISPQRILRERSEIAIRCDVPSSVRAGLFRLEGGRWEYLPGTRAHDVFRAPTSRLGTFGVFSDSMPPAVTVLEPRSGRELLAGEKVIATVTDSGSGVRPDGVRVLVDGEERPSRFNAETGRLEFEAPTNLVDGLHVIEIAAEDRLGNSVRSDAIPMRAVNRIDTSSIQSYPNPARTSATIQYRLSAPVDEVVISIYDTSGERVFREEGPTTPSPVPHTIVWDLAGDSGDPVANGVYIYRVKIRRGDDIVEGRGKIVVLR